MVRRFLLAGIFSASLFIAHAQDIPGPQSAADLDRENAKVTELISRRLSTLESGIRVSVGSFGFDGYDTSLGAYWRENLISGLSNLSGRSFTVTDGGSRTDYMVTGEITNIANIARIHVRLIKTGDASVTAGWHTDLEQTEFILNLLDTGSSSGRRISRDNHEPDGRENPLAVEAGETWINRTIHNENDQDWFLFTALNGGGAACFETSGDFDTVMELYDEEGSLLDENDDGGEDSNARIDYPLEGGKRYIARVRGYSGSTGAYGFRIQLAEISDSAMESNNTEEQAFAIDLDTEINGYFPVPSDEDWYRVEIPAEGGQFTAGTGGHVDTFITIYDGDGNEIAEDDDSGDRYNARVSVLVSGGPLYVRVTAYEGRGDYTLQTQLREPVGLDSYEPDNTRQNAKPINAGETQRRTFSQSDNDWVSFTVNQRGYYVFQARGETSNNLDTYLELFDDENIIGEDDDGGEEYSSRLRIRLDPGTYYIKIYCLDDEAGEPYLFSVDAE
ncbi:MAG: PPC domain-containing protein [Treponema sp.]|jgi:hypothetical protein|nr:PPC domain-containing protein [Treponema sp.]